MLEPAEVKRWERMTDAMLRHAAADDPAAFAQVVAVLDRARASLPNVADRLVYGAGQVYPTTRETYSWGDIGAALGISRQAARQRFARRND